MSDVRFSPLHTQGNWGTERLNTKKHDFKARTVFYISCLQPYLCWCAREMNNKQENIYFHVIWCPEGQRGRRGGNLPLPLPLQRHKHKLAHHTQINNNKKRHINLELRVSRKCGLPDAHTTVIQVVSLPLSLVGSYSDDFHLEAQIGPPNHKVWRCGHKAGLGAPPWMPEHPAGSAQPGSSGIRIRAAFLSFNSGIQVKATGRGPVISVIVTVCSWCKNSMAFILASLKNKNKKKKG